MKNLIKYLAERIRSNSIGAYSAQSAFFMLLSIFPLLMLVLSILSRFALDTNSIVSFISPAVPGEVAKFLTDIIGDMRSRSTTVLSSVTAVALLWSASKGVYALCEGLTKLVGDKSGRGYFRSRFMSVLYTLLFILLLLTVFVLFVLGNSILTLLGSHFTFIRNTAAIFDLIRLVFGFAVLTFTITLVYRFLPGGKRRFSVQLRGGAICAAGWMVFSYGFQLYVDNFSSYSAVYGSITALILLMLWLYSCMYMLFAGAIINEYFAQDIN